MCVVWRLLFVSSQPFPSNALFLPLSQPPRPATPRQDSCALWFQDANNPIIDSPCTLHGLVRDPACTCRMEQGVMTEEEVAL